MFVAASGRMGASTGPEARSGLLDLATLGVRGDLTRLHGMRSYPRPSSRLSSRSSSRSPPPKTKNTYTRPPNNSVDGSPLPEFLHSKRILQLDVGLLIAGAKERGELESRVTKLIAEIREAGNIILM